MTNPAAKISKEAVARLTAILNDADADYADEVSDAATTGERPDLWSHEVEVPVEDLRSILSALPLSTPLAFTPEMVKRALFSRPRLQGRDAYLDLREALGFEIDEVNEAFVLAAFVAAFGGDHE